MRKKLILGLFIIVFLMTGSSYGNQEARLLRFPAIHNDLIVFTYAGDLYSVFSQGGVARKLTSHEGFEIFARFSPDGKYIAFTGEYDGNREVYLIPREGGTPKRLTFTPTLGRDDISDRMGPNNIVMGWKHDNSSIVFRSRMHEWNDFNGQLYLASIQGGTPEQIPLPRGGFCSFSQDDQKIAYNRIFREFRTWKRYRGGMADDIWIYDFKTKKIQNITNNPAQDIIPMWHEDKIYFLSDRDENKKMNLYVYDVGTQETRKLTNFSEFDIKFPSLAPKAIVFENGGYLFRFDIEKEEAKKIPVIIADDMNSGRSKLVEVNEKITNYEISPDGKRALFGARGEIFTVPAKYGNTRNLTNTCGVHERSSKWSPDGKWIAFISDATGEDEIYIIPQDGSGPPQKLTKDADTYKYQIIWSPDSSKILWNDKLLRLNYLDIKTKKVVQVAKADAWEITSYSWSPDSKWIAYAKPEAETMTKIYIYNIESQKSYEVTDGWYSSYAPAFHSNGKYLFFVSDRDFGPVFSRTEWNHAYLSMSRIYLVTLSKEVKSPFEPKSDEVVPNSKDKAKIEKGEIKKESKTPSEKPDAEGIKIKVDPEGLNDRIIQLPIEVANYWHITSVDDTIYYMKRGDKDKKSSLIMYDISKQKETQLGNINGYEISHDQKKMIVSQNKSYAIIDIPKSEIKIEEKLDLSNMEMNLNLKEEWEQIFNECWRQMKYFFYAPNMHGVDWQMLRSQYEPLAKAVNHRADLTYVIGEMIGELNVGHTYIGGGDYQQPKRIPVGMLGAQFQRDENTGYYKIQRILKGKNWDKSARSPLTEVGVNVSEGNFIVSINGKPTNTMKDIYKFLWNTVGKQVTLQVNSKPEEKGSWKAVVMPIKDELSLYYYNWVQRNIEKVNKATNGKVGYIHVPDMGVRGLNEFVKHFYPQLRKKALIIDVRGNGGGNVSPMLIERLRREIVMIEMARNTTQFPDPDAVLMGPKVCLIDEFSASDGDIFPYRFKKLKLGKIIGKRTWGGVVGIRGTLPLVDGGYMMKPEFAPYSIDGKEWVIEGKGVEPDIYVDNDPAKEYEGIDEQLNKAIEVVLEELKTKEKSLPPIPPYPIKKK
ncbi:MAG: PD40 domain-containing protein [Candidatus Aminicenantes bacterium]|nr:PD40 domain-containing protein [Candidatus Aminicenantes bacterium]